MANNFDRFLPDYQVGTLTLTEGETAFTAADASLTFAAIRPGDFIIAPTGLIARIASISDDSHGELIEVCPAGMAGTYRTCIRFQSDNSRYTGQQAALIKLLSGGNLSALARLVGEPDSLLAFTGSGTMEVIPRGDMTNGVKYDAMVDDLAGRALYDSQAKDFAVLVADIGDGRSAVFTKRTPAPGNWSAPAYVTGPVGPMPTIDIAETETLPPGQQANVSLIPTPNGVQLVFSIPSGKGFTSRGAYVAATTYQIGDVVSYLGSAYIADKVTQGVVPTNQANWSLLVAKGTDGTGTGDVSGPSASVANRLAIFNGTTGKLIADSGLTIDQIRANTSNVGAAVAGANGRELFNDADSVAGVISGTGTMVRWTWGNIKAWVRGFITKGDVGLPDVDNTSDALKPVSTAQAAAIALKVTKGGDTGLGGFTAAGKPLGNLVGTVALTPTGGNMQYGNNVGAFTISAPPDGYYTMIVTITNVAGAGAITLTGFSAPPVGAFDVTVGKVHDVQVRVSGSNKIAMIMGAS